MKPHFTNLVGLVLLGILVGCSDTGESPSVEADATNAKDPRVVGGTRRRPVYHVTRTTDGAELRQFAGWFDRALGEMCGTNEIDGRLVCAPRFVPLAAPGSLVEGYDAILTAESCRDGLLTGPFWVSHPDMENTQFVLSASTRQLFRKLPNPTPTPRLYIGGEGRCDEYPDPSPHYPKPVPVEALPWLDSWMPLQAGDGAPLSDETSGSLYRIRVRRYQGSDGSFNTSFDVVDTNNKLVSVHTIEGHTVGLVKPLLASKGTRLEPRALVDRTPDGLQIRRGGQGYFYDTKLGVACTVDRTRGLCMPSQFDVLPEEAPPAFHRGFIDEACSTEAWAVQKRHGEKSHVAQEFLSSKVYPRPETPPSGASQMYEQRSGRCTPISVSYPIDVYAGAPPSELDSSQYVGSTSKDKTF